MKHRSVIAFVIVAAALFSLPQLSNDLQALKGAAGARLHRELLRTFLSLPAGEPTAAVPVARPAETLLASCPQEKLAPAAGKAGKVEASGRVEGRATEKSIEQRAMINDPAHDPINQLARVQINEAADKFVASLPEVKVETEVAMIVLPETGIDPRGVAGAFASTGAARVEADKLLVQADGLRVAYATAARAQANNPEWQKAAEETFRKLNGSLPGAHEFRLVRDGAKTRLLKLKCNECPAPAPRPTRLPRQVALTVPPPAEWVSE